MFMRQWNSFSCAPTTLRICASAFNGIRLRRHLASFLCKTSSDGTTWYNLKRGFRAAGLKVIDIKKHSVKEWDAWLDLGYFIVAADDLTYSNPHVVVVRNSGDKMFGILDPVIGFPHRKPKNEVIRSAQRHAFAVCSA